MSDTNYINLVGGRWAARQVCGDSLADVLARAAVEVAKLESLPPHESVTIRVMHNIDTEGVNDILIVTEGYAHGAH